MEKQTFGSITIDTTDFVKKIGKWHDGLCNIMDEINFCYSIQTMIDMIPIFGLILLTIFTGYRYIMAPNEHYFAILLMYIVLSCFYTFFAVSIIHHSSSLTRTVR